MSEDNFSSFLGQVASRLRHDLKGGLLTLKMGLESLPADEALKPLLLEKAQELVTLSDKLVLLLRMGKVNPKWLPAEVVMRQAILDCQPEFPLEMVLSVTAPVGRWNLDNDALTLALKELCQNAYWSDATKVELILTCDGKFGTLVFSDNGSGVSHLTDLERSRITEVGTSYQGRSGLGLAIVERCILGHLGCLSFEEQKNGFGLRMCFQREGFGDPDLELAAP